MGVHLEREGGIRDLDEIQETEPGEEGGLSSRLGALLLATASGACIVFAAAALMRAPSGPRENARDPLGDLVAKAHPAGAPGPVGVGRPVTFPSILSDTKNTTALEAVRGVRGRPHAAPASPDAASADGSGPGAPGEPPGGASAFAPQPLPAAHVLSGSIDAGPDDRLTSMARHVAREQGAEGEAGRPGGYQLQVSSFKQREEAEPFAAALRRRGHRAYVEPAYVPGRGLWHRVRIGPFKYKHSAVIYRQDFEAKERLVTFIVDPPKTKVTVAALPPDDPAPQASVGAHP